MTATLQRQRGDVWANFRSIERKLVATSISIRSYSLKFVDVAVARRIFGRRGVIALIKLAQGHRFELLQGREEELETK